MTRYVPRATWQRTVAYNGGRRIIMSVKRSLAMSAASAALFLAGTGAAFAQTTTVSCDDATVLPNPVYMAGSSAFEPTLAQLALQIKANQGFSIIYSAIASCNGVSAISDGTALTGTAHYYTVTPALDGGVSGGVTTNSCTLPTGTKASIGVSDVAFQSCTGNPLPTTTIGEWHGPVQSMLIVVPKANQTTTAMSMAQAAAIWGCGTKGNQTPFTDPNAIQQRDQTSGTQIMFARNIGVPEAAFVGTKNTSGGNLVTALLAVANPQTAIGILAADAYATRRSTLNAVAFQGSGQTKAYYADSDANAVDKKNVRDGHYVIQGPLHFFTSLAAGQPTATAKQILEWLSGSKAIDPTDVSNTNYVATVASLGDVPQCAMKVQVDTDGGKFSPYTPPTSCNCFFEKSAAKLTSAPSGCVACTTDAQCSGGKRCQTGYCE